MTTVPLYCGAPHPTLGASVKCRLIADGHATHYGTDRHTGVGYFWPVDPEGKAP